MSVASLATHRPICSFVGTRSASSCLSSARTHTSIPSAASRTFSRSRTRAPSATCSVCVTACFLSGIPRSTLPAPVASRFSGEFDRRETLVAILTFLFPAHNMSFSPRIQPASRLTSSSGSVALACSFVLSLRRTQTRPRSTSRTTSLTTTTSRTRSCAVVASTSPSRQSCTRSQFSSTVARSCPRASVRAGRAR